MLEVTPQSDKSSVEEAKAQNPARICPAEILNAQRVLDVRYLGFDGDEHDGQIVVHEGLANEVMELFAFLLRIRFPLRSVMPASKFNWDDEFIMKSDNCSGFNYRFIAGTERLSWHAHGRALDLNPVENPCITTSSVVPEGGIYDPAKPGTVTADGPVVKFLEERGWTWGGRWTSLKDYQHFEKPFETAKDGK